MYSYFMRCLAQKGQARWLHAAIPLEAFLERLAEHRRKAGHV